MVPRLLAILLFAGLPLTASAAAEGARAALPAGQVRVIILYSRHLGAHGLGYNDRSLRELSQQLSPADIPAVIALLKDSKVRVGAQFALASQCGASIVPVREAAARGAMDFLDAADVLDLIASYTRCQPEARAQARTTRVEVNRLRDENLARTAEGARKDAENDARIQHNALKMMDPQRKRELTREERIEVYQRSLKAAGLSETGPLTPAQKQMVERMYRTMVLDEPGPAGKQ